MLTFVAETREYAAGASRSNDRPSGKEITDHLESVAAALPSGGENRPWAGGFGLGSGGGLRKEEVAVHRGGRKTSRSVDELRAAEWKRSRRVVRHDRVLGIEFCDEHGRTATMVWFCNQHAGAENLIKEANNDAGLTAQ